VLHHPGECVTSVRRVVDGVAPAGQRERARGQWFLRRYVTLAIIMRPQRRASRSCFHYSCSLQTREAPRVYSPAGSGSGRRLGRSAGPRHRGRQARPATAEDGTASRAGCWNSTRASPGCVLDRRHTKVKLWTSAPQVNLCYPPACLVICFPFSLGPSNSARLKSARPLWMPPSNQGDDDQQNDQVEEKDNSQEVR